MAEHDPRLDLLLEVMGELNQIEKALLTLFLEDLSYDEIATVMGMKANHVGVMLHRVKKKLAELMKEVPA